MAVTDLRRGVLVKSEDQEEELLSSIFVDGLSHRPNRSKGAKVLVGGGDGVLTLWERGVWDDQDERIIVDKDGESLDVLARIPDHIGNGAKNIAVGLGDGTIRVVQLGANKVTRTFRHDDMEGVVGLGFDVEGRMVSGGGAIVKIWQQLEEDDEDEDDESDSDESDDSDDEENVVPGTGKRPNEEDSNEAKEPKKKKKVVENTGILNFDID